MAALAAAATAVSIFALKWAKASLQASRDAIKITRDIGRAQVRAYIAVSNFEITDFETGKTPKIKYMVKNTGSTPALRWESRSTLAYVKDPETHKFRSDFTGWDGTLLDIPSGGKAFQEFDLDNLTTGWRTAMLEGRWAPVVYGHGRYRDVFGRLHRFVFCYYFKPENIKNGRAELWPTRRHNRSN